MKTKLKDYLVPTIEIVELTTEAFFAGSLVEEDAAGNVENLTSEELFWY